MENSKNNDKLDVLKDAFTTIGEFLIENDAIDASEAGDDQYDKLIRIHNRLAHALGINASTEKN